jgi:hypothetical protein
VKHLTADQKHSVQKIMDGARLIFSIRGGVTAVGFIEWMDFDNTRHIDVVQMKMCCEEHKEASIAVCRKRAQVENAHLFVMVSEAWLAVVKRGDAPPDRKSWPSPSQMPSREEVIIVSVETAAGRQCARATITRPPEGAPVLGPWEWLDATPDRDSRFSNVIQSTTN